MDPMNKYDPETADDLCPVCKEHPEDIGYLLLTSGQVVMMCCQKCGVVYVPESIQKAMEAHKQKVKESSNLIIPAGVAS
jgi:5,10-methylenetetrahydrofolate reductase